MKSEVLPKLISLVFSPFITATFTWGVVITEYASSATDFAKLFGLLLLTAVGVPSLYILHGVWKGSITDVHLKVRAQRFIPLSLAIASSLLLAFLYQWLDAPRELVVTAIIMTSVGVVFTAITLFWKISFHVAIFTAGVLILGGLVGWEWLWGFVFLPAIIWARLKRRRHDIWQALAAIAVAASTVFGMMYWLL